MHSFHSTVSRRDFMKTLGLAGAGVAATAVSAPVFHDLDELAASVDHPTNPWWVKQRDYEDITSEIDWKVFQQWDKKNNNIPPPSAENIAMRAERDYNYDKEGLVQKIPGRDRRSYALGAMVTGLQTAPAWDGTADLADASQTTFAEGEVPIWEDTPENNLQTMRAAIHYMGSNNVGAIELNEHMLRIFDKDAVIFEDIAKGFQDSDKVYHIPSSCKWMVTCSIQQNYTHCTYQLREDPENYPGKLGLPNSLGRPAIHRAYGDGRYVDWMLQRFINKLGYQAYKAGVTANVALGIFSGLGEQGRATYMMTPRSGLMTRITNYWITDLPLSPTKPIDFGGTKFCETCGRCSEKCPSEALGAQKEPTWEYSKGNRPGYKGWRVDWEKCVGMGAPGRCGVCHTLCPFNHPNDGTVHPLVRSVSCITPVFNSFFSGMDRQFGYGQPKTYDELNDWWIRDLNAYKADVIHGAGTYNW
nr:reductive dehalogenase [uncultured bacterium]UZH91545.1 reductive dehalogenase [uncultured bacterium]UZH91569.1 reductive dehalogenase [uncultured bacterium]UZH91589.1 reductive dehalogenase [uncultured bacterium]UZH91625.1 reductive dehalogenase [uncultured bacterium]